MGMEYGGAEDLQNLYYYYFIIISLMFRKWNTTAIYILKNR